MYPLFESLKVVDGQLQNIKWHQMRYERSYKAVYHKLPLGNITSHITIPNEAKKGVFKLRISYNEQYKKIEFEPYSIKEIRTVKIIEANNINYNLKYSDRTALLEAYKKRGSCDDVLIIKNGKVTDTSYANIAFYNGQNWCTPDSPLLKGTAREKLLAEGVIKEQDIHLEDIKSFKAFKIINALRDFNIVQQTDIACIMR